VFLVNSRLGQFSAASSSSGSKSLHSTEAPLLPKLRGHFAEFLNEGYLDHLSMLYLPTCVGFGTGAFLLPRGFSWRYGISDSPTMSADVHSRASRVADFPTTHPTVLSLDYQRQGSLTLPRPPFGDNEEDAVQEYQPVVHRLRLSASA
jgi:hypothetical protein